MKIIDAQVHIGPTNGVGWLPDHRPMTAETLLGEMNSAGVAGAVLVPPSFLGDDNSTAMAASRDHPHRFAVMGRLNLADGASRGMLERWTDLPGMLGLRLIFHTPSQIRQLEDGTADWVWRAAEDADVPIALYVPGRERLIERIAGKHPELRLTIDHFNLPKGAIAQESSESLQALARLASYDNVSVKASAMPGFANDSYPYLSVHEPVRRMVEAFGAHRVFWGTDLSHCPCSYTQAISLFTEEMSFLTSAEVSLIMGEALCAWLRWPIGDVTQFS